MDQELQKKRGPQSIGKNVAGNGTKIHVIVGKGGLLCAKTTGAQVHDSKPVIEMLAPINFLEIERFVADKAYDNKKIRSFLLENGVYAEIPNKKRKKNQDRFDKTVYKWRYKVENFFQKIKENRRLSMRYDKLDETFAGFFALALIKMQVC